MRSDWCCVLLGQLSCPLPVFLDGKSSGDSPSAPVLGGNLGVRWVLKCEGFEEEHLHKGTQKFLSDFSETKELIVPGSH